MIVFAIILLAGLYGLPWFMENVYYDNASEAWDKVDSEFISPGTEVKFMGYVKDSYQDTQYTGMGVIWVDDFDAPVYVNSNEVISRGTKIIIEGKYYGTGISSFNLGGVTGGSLLGVPMPAEIKEVWWERELCSLLNVIAWLCLVTGIGIGIISGVRSDASDKKYKQKPQTEISYPDSKISVEVAQTPPKETIRCCPECGARGQDNSDYCDNCNFVKLIEITKPDDYEEPEDDNMESIFCTECGEKIDADSKFCKFCGYEIERTPKGYCGNCGTLNDEDAKFCKMCGCEVGS